jgi:hypothetical protein
MRFSIEGKKSNKDFSKEKKEILRIFNDAANDYCLKYKKKPRFR